MIDESSVFDLVARDIAHNVANASPKEIILICRKTFRGIKELLSPALMDIPEQLIFDVDNSLYKILNEYRKLEDRGGVEYEILKEIHAIKPVLTKAISQINVAVTIQTDMKMAGQNKVEYYQYLPLYYDAMYECYDRVAEINRIISGLDDIVID